MSRFLKKDGKQSSFEHFNKHLIYKNKINSIDYPNIVNFNLAEKAMYGKVFTVSIPDK